MNNRQQGDNRDQDHKRSEQGGQKDQRQNDPRQQSQHDQGRGQQGGAGNFANDRERASEAGRKGGQGAAEEKRSNRDDDTASEADRKGGQR